jgi:hypothetical protein
VKLNVRKVLDNFVTTVRGEKDFYQIKFGKIPKFYGTCGFLVHTHLECGTSEHDEEKLMWGDWLEADYDKWLKADYDTWHRTGFATRGGTSGRQG